LDKEKLNIFLPTSLKFFLQIPLCDQVPIKEFAPKQPLRPKALPQPQALCRMGRPEKGEVAPRKDRPGSP
jgi:hypothetical protein